MFFIESLNQSSTIKHTAIGNTIPLKAPAIKGFTTTVLILIMIVTCIKIANKEIPATCKPCNKLGASVGLSR